MSEKLNVYFRFIVVGYYLIFVIGFGLHYSLHTDEFYYATIKHEPIYLSESNEIASQLKASLQSDLRIKP